LQKISRGPLIAVASSILLPYGVVTTNTAIETQAQHWLFPLWTYVHDFGVWLDYGVIIPPFSASVESLLSLLGLIWFAFGFCISMALYRFYSGQTKARLVWLPALSMLVLQTGLTIIAAFIVWSEWIAYVIPLPLSALIALSLLRIKVQGVDDWRVATDDSGNGRTSSV